MTTPPSLVLFKGRHFDQEIIVLCVRWYLSFKLSSRDLVRMMAERGVVLAHTTILRWVQRYVPEFEKCWSRYARDVDGSWRCDETYIKVRTLDLSLSSSRQRWADGGLFVERTPGCGRGQMFLHQRNPTPRNATRDHSGCLCRFASGHPGTEIRG
jgi:hypothetical protein